MGGPLAGDRRHPRCADPAALVFAADHGVTAAGVSKYPTDVTAAMLAAYRAGRSTVSRVRRGRRGDGRRRSTSASAARPATSASSRRWTRSASTRPSLAGRDAVDALDADLLVLGEMGIGNTTAAAAVAAALGGGEVAAWVGRGTGVDDAGLARKREAVRESVDRIAGVLDPLEVLREVGGAELVAMAAAIVAARHRRLPVLIDGYVVTAAALPLHVIDPGALDHCLVGHCSSEPGHRRLLERLGKQPLLDLEMRLGEGSGAMAAVPLVAMACAGITQVPTFAEWFG